MGDGKAALHRADPRGTQMTANIKTGRAEALPVGFYWVS